MTKGNPWTATELADFVDAMRDGSVAVARPDADPRNRGANYDGKTDPALLGVVSGLVVAVPVTPIVVHSAGRVRASEEVAYGNVLDELWAETDLAPRASAATVDEGIRILPPSLANPVDVDAHLASSFHLSLARKLVEALQESEQGSTAPSRSRGWKGTTTFDPHRAVRCVGRQVP